MIVGEPGVSSPDLMLRKTLLNIMTSPREDADRPPDIAELWPGRQVEICSGQLAGAQCKIAWRCDDGKYMLTMLGCSAGVYVTVDDEMIRAVES